MPKTNDLKKYIHEKKRGAGGLPKDMTRVMNSSRSE